MKNYKTLWAAKARAKNVSSCDMVERCIIKAVISTHENKVELAKILLNRAFSPSKKKTPSLAALRYAILLVRSRFTRKREFLFVNSVFDQAEEFDNYYDVLVELVTDMEY